MAGRGPAPAEGRVRTEEPARGEWRRLPVVGWQHGEIPPLPPRAKSEAARTTWETWFGSWYAAHWTPEDLPNLRLAIQLWAKAYAGTASGSERTALRHHMDDLGMTRKGQQDRRWAPPVDASARPSERPSEGTADVQPSPYSHLRAVS